MTECHTHVISSINIHSAIQLLKSGNNDGFDGLTSKAFDHVNFYILFILLRNCNFCILYLGFFIYFYCNHRMSVRWNSYNSR